MVTDHLALKWLLSIQEPRDRWARWVLEIMDHEFVIEHKAGKELVVPDAMSRDAVPKPLCQRCRSPIDRESQSEKICAVAEVPSFAGGPSINEMIV